MFGVKAWPSNIRSGVTNLSRSGETSAVPVPYNHANVDSDEVLFYAGGDFMSRRGVGIQAGSLTLTMAVPAWYSNHMKPIDAFTLPYIVSSADRLKAALDGNVGKEINRMGQGAGFHVFGYWLLGGRHIVQKRGPWRPQQLHGLWGDVAIEASCSACSKPVVSATGVRACEKIFASTRSTSAASASCA